MNFWKRKPKIEKKESATGSVVSMFNVGQPVWSGRDYTSFAKEGYEQNVVANRCISLIAKGVASVNWELFAGDTKLEKSPLLDLLANPNKTQSSCDFFEAVAAFKLIAGNSYIEAAFPGGSLSPNTRPPTYLYNLPPQNMKIIKGTKGRVAAYEFELSGAKVRFPVSNAGISNILQIKSFNPTDGWYGLSSVESGAYAIDQHNEASAWNQALLQNGARPSGALIVKSAKEGGSGSLSDDQYNRLKSDLEDKYSGKANSGKPLLLEGGLEWQEMSLTPKDMDWLQGKDSVARDIAMAFGVPSQLLGIPGDSTYNNMQEARLALWEQTIIPLLDEITAHLNSWLVPRYGDGLELKYSKENIDALRIKREMQRKSLEETSFMTINEKRKAMGMEEIDGGDELLVDSNKIPVTLANEPVEKNTEQLFTETLKELGFSDAEIKAQIIKEQ